MTFSTLPTLVIRVRDNISVGLGAYRVDGCVGSFDAFLDARPGTTDTIVYWTVPQVGTGQHSVYLMASDQAGNVMGSVCDFKWKFNLQIGCCTGTTGNVNGVGTVDLSDLSTLVAYLTGTLPQVPCTPAANINATGTVDLADLSALVNYLTGGGYVLPNCP
jgi:hypothetical protein